MTTDNQKLNGERDLSEDLSQRELLEVLVEAVGELTEKIDMLKEGQDVAIEQQAEIIEKITNISTPGGDFTYSDYR